MDALYLYPKGSPAIDATVKFDATVDEKRTAKWPATTRPVEADGKISDYVGREPKEHTFSGILTALPMDDEPGRDRVNKIVDVLRKYGDDREVVTVVFGWWKPFDGVITDVDESSSLQDGEALRVSVTVREVRQTVARSTQIPASRLKPKQKRRKAKPPGPNKQSGKPAGSKVLTSKAYRLRQGKSPF